MTFPPWAREVGHEATSYGIGTDRHDDRGRRGGMHGGPSRERYVSNDQIHIEPDQLCCEGRQTIIAPLDISPVDEEILSFDVPESTQTLP